MIDLASVPGLLVSCSLLLLASAHPARAQATPDQLRTLLVDYAGFSDADLVAMNNGKIVVKLVKTTNKHDVAVFGIVRNPTLPQFTMQAFRESLSQKGNKEIEAKGRFSRSPVITDFTNVVLEDRDLEELQKCRVGDCDINMSAKWINRFADEIDWKAPDHRQRTNELFRAMLLEYATQYGLRGVASLGTLVNRRQPVDLYEAQRELLKKLPLLDNFAFGLREHMANFPAASLFGIQDELYWSLMDFGLKPTVTLTHAAMFTNGISSQDSHFVLTRQFYSSRYLDASVSLATLLRVPNGEGVETLIVFADRSRSDALGGVFAGVARGVVEKEAIDRTTEILKTAELRLISQASSQSKLEPTSESSGKGTTAVWTTWVLPIALVGAVLTILIFALTRKRHTKR